MSYPAKSLSELCNIVIGRTPARKEAKYWGKGNKWVSISDLNSKVVCETKEEITDYAVEQKRCRKIPKGTLLFSFKLTIGKMAFAGCDLYTNEAIAALLIKDKDQLNRDYLFFALQVAKLIGSNQAVMGKTLNSKSLAKIEIPLPLLDDQKRIAYVLGKVEGLIAERKQHLQQLDDLLKSVFLEMFGDPVRNEKGWIMLTGKAYSTRLTVGVVVKPASYYVEEGVIALRSLNIKPNRIELDNLVFFSEQANEGPLAKSILRAGDVVIVRTGKTGTAAVVPRELDGANCIDLILVRPKIGVLNPHYLASLLNSERGIALVASKEVGGIQKHFNVGAMNRIPFPIPPIELQDEFATIVEKVESIKTSYQQSLTDLENLYGALSQKAFKGDLDLSRVPLPSEDTDTTATEPPDTSEPPPATETFTLPAPPELTTLHSAKGRQDLINQWLAAWIDHLNNAPFSTQDFMEAAQQRLWKLAEELENNAEEPKEDTEELRTVELGAAEYDHLKAWIFESLKSGRLAQSYDDANNCVLIKAADK
ncbi:restriction endonuclease subunit S [Halomicronema sp. CCY15110]|uniref:restriction endonuclease subunit S n=1 Tax=Halomicronema sp. CCY15110 TaxID=2767773 RepID=UPI001951CD7E|nr:restriction endonuclease subunit S [Halomicronema sp. CCY15110]